MSNATRCEYHDPFCSEVEQHLLDNDFLATCPAYHEHFPLPMVERMRRLDTPTTDLARNGADLFAIHRTLPLALFAEAKTHRSSRYHNLAVEARQFVQRLEEARNGCLCLFCYRDPGLRDVGFWMHECPQVECVLIPLRWSDEQAAEWGARFAKALPNVPVRRTRGTAGGSDTPFVLISERELVELWHWRDLLSAMVQQVSALQEVGAL